MRVAAEISHVAGAPACYGADGNGWKYVRYISVFDLSIIS